jgi:hypothetical protein
MEVQIKISITRRHQVDSPRNLGLSFIRTKTGSGLRQPGVRASARAELTATNGLIPLLCINALKRIGTGASNHNQKFACFI